MTRAARIDNPTTAGRGQSGRHIAPGGEEVTWLERA
jgi:hypothetical protein